MRIFDVPWLLTALPVAAGLAALAVLGGFGRRQGRLARFGSPAALARLGPPGATRRPTARAWRLGIAGATLAIGIAGPRWGEGTLATDEDGVDIALALDVSLSMLAEDERPNRLERMKQEVRRLRASAPGDRVALLAFAGRSYILAPLTSDDGALELFLENLDPTIVGQAGSAIAPPLRQGLDLLAATPGTADRALVVMSDGEAFDDREAALLLAAEAQKAGVLLVTVGFGTPGGSTIPLLETGGTDVKRDADGAVVVTRYDESLLRELAQAAGGEFIPAEATDKGTRVHRALSDLETSRRAEEQRLARPLRYQWFVAFAVLLLIVDALFADGARLPRRSELRRRLTDTAVAAAFMLLWATPLRAQGDQLGRAIDHHRAGRLLPAIRAYRGAVAGGDRRPVVLYDLGTALLSADSLDAAVEALERAAFAGEPELRVRALYNLGLAQLKRGLRTEGDARDNSLRNARRAFRTVLLERPGDRDAQWNYELALRAPQQGGGGGGGGQPPPQPSSGPRGEQPRSEMSRQQAEALLESAAREERETLARRQRGNRVQRVAGERDW
jgi:Ca-activated chloride channel family protein